MRYYFACGRYLVSDKVFPIWGRLNLGETLEREPDTLSVPAMVRWDEIL